MTMYLPNPDLHPTGFEPGEFIDVPATARELTGGTRPAKENNQWTPPTDRPAAPPPST
jgi:hypothetical protein